MYVYMSIYIYSYIIIRCIIHTHTLLLDFKVTFAVFDLQEDSYSKDFIFPVSGKTGIPALLLYFLTQNCFYQSEE